MVRCTSCEGGNSYEERNPCSFSSFDSLRQPRELQDVQIDLETSSEGPSLGGLTKLLTERVDRPDVLGLTVDLLLQLSRLTTTLEIVDC